MEARIRTPLVRPGGVGSTSLAAGWTRGCPYRGLLRFREDDTDVFYGRELLTAELTVLAARQIRSGGMVVVTGASGAGKSSLLRAGLLPALARGEAGAGSQEWARFVITPGEAPLNRLAAPIEALGGGHRRGGSLRGVLADYPAEAAAVLRQAVEVDLLSRRREVRNGGRMVLIVDQFEQLFTLNPGPEGEAERQAFIAALCAMGTGSASPGGVPPALVVIAVRGDFWARCAEYPLLAPHLRDGQFVVGPMTEPELRLAITGPADAAGLRIEESLPDTIVRDLRTARARSGAGSGADSAGVLPLLSEAMRQTWENREGDRLTSRGYARAGGVSQAVRNRADAVYDALQEPRQAIAREILLRMTVAGQDGEFARRPADRAELYTGHAAEDVDAVLEVLRTRAWSSSTSRLYRSPTMSCCTPGHGCVAGWNGTGGLCSCTASWPRTRRHGTATGPTRRTCTVGRSWPQSGKQQRSGHRNRTATLRLPHSSVTSSRPAALPRPARPGGAAPP
jgi:energy-coupling factor transporter ATP-binding protein EcfA2